MEGSESVLVPGYRLDRYELMCPIASGGMASVWVARLRGKRGFEKLFAIKTIKAELITDPRYHEMFLDEARITSGIDHPNVAHIVDLGEQHENLYIVMEWVDGEALAKLHRIALKQGRPLPTWLTLRVIADACAGLHAAHELKNLQGESLGVIHRDVSPQNVLVNVTGQAKVIDFGVAKAHRRGAGDTASGVVKGKIRYMAPEQVAGRPMDRRADIWALGICLHELLDGRPPYDDLSDIEVVKHLMGEDPAPKFDSRTYSESLRAVLGQSLHVDPDRRFPTAMAMRRGLEDALAEQDAGDTSDDVAEYIRTRFPELEAKRRETVARALSAAEERESGRSVVGRLPGMEDAAAEGDLGLAPTQIGAPEAISDSRLEVGAERDRRDESRKTSSTGGSSLTDQLEVPRTRSPVPVLAIVAVAAALGGAWFGWPGAARIRAALAPEATSASATAPSVTPRATSGAPSPHALTQLDASPLGALDVDGSARRSADGGPASTPPAAASSVASLDAGADAPPTKSPGSQWIAVRGEDGVIEWVRRDAGSPQTAPSSSVQAPAHPTHPTSASPRADAEAP